MGNSSKNDELGRTGRLGWDAAGAPATAVLEWGGGWTDEVLPGPNTLGAVGENGDCSGFSEILLLRGGGGTGLVPIEGVIACGLFLGFESSKGMSYGDL